VSMSRSSAGRAARVLRVVAVPAAAAALAGVAALASTPPAADALPYVTWIENRASRAFDPATPQLRGLQAGYRVDAHVLLPLGFTSLELWSRTDVGMAVASYRDFAADAGDVLRAYELFSESRPERARGFDRRGFFREAVRLTPGGAAWTAYFGAMTSWPEKTLAEARRSADGPQPHTYEAIDGLSAPLETRSSVFLVATDRKLSGPNDLWAAVRPQLDAGPPRHSESIVGTAARPLPTLAFLGALQISLRSAAVHRAAPLAPRATRVAFTHNGQVRQLELASIDPDPVRGRLYPRPEIVRNPADVFQLRYRIINPGAEDGEFRIWIELPADVRDDPHAAPLAPLAWEMQLRSYLKLVFERTS
jgi:hypothetical protein